MKRLRWLSALLACLAALATGAPAFAGVSSLAVQSTSVIEGVGSNCQHCPDCDAVPCPQTIDCIAPCAMAAPVVAVAALELPSLAGVAPLEPARTNRLIGERPPPDLLPPRR